MTSEVVQIVGVSKKFKGVVALNDVSISVKKNTIFGLLGSNGAGKTTLLHILSGLLSYSQGDVYIFDEKTKKHSKSLKRRIAIVPQKISLYEELTIKENIHFFGKAYGIKRKELKDKIQMWADILQLGDLKRKVKFLSGGYQRRVSIAVALIGDPEIIILDEALVGIDLETKRIITNLLIELKETKTIILTTHSIHDAEILCDDICFLHRGVKIMDGSTKDIIYRYASRQGNKVNLTFDDFKIAEKIMILIQDSVKEVTREGNVLHVRIFSDRYGLSYILDIIRNAKERYKDIEIKKPGLEEVIFRFMQSDYTNI
ncbi:MAG: ABC transporter ATP-binding protein [Nanoarchaeota archaeon]|nr:ABC transporter ATP-binding protein [Nanoarchaeota archaeon]